MQERMIMMTTRKIITKMIDNISNENRKIIKLTICTKCYLSNGDETVNIRPCFDLRSSRAITSLCKQLPVCDVSLYLTDTPTVFTITTHDNTIQID